MIIVDGRMLTVGVFLIKGMYTEALKERNE